MSAPFVRQLGSESGVQLNPLRDNSEIPVSDNQDQIFGIALRATRGRIDKPFKVDRGNVYSKLGKGEMMRSSTGGALNEAWVQVVEALNSGAYEAVVQRITVAGTPVIKQAVMGLVTPAILTPVVSPAGVITSVTVTSSGSGYLGLFSSPPIVFSSKTATAGAVATAVVSPAGVITSVTITNRGAGYVNGAATTCSAVLPEGIASNALPAAGTYLLAVKHLECFNDGIVVEYHADEKRTGGVIVANPMIYLRLRDKDGVLLYDFYGSFDPAARDDYGNSSYLPDVVATATDALEVTVLNYATIPPTHPAYGYDAADQEKWVKSGLLYCFVEGSTGYLAADYVAACRNLQYTPLNYSYIASGGSQNVSFISRLAQLAFDTNRQLRFDVPGKSTVAEAIAFVEQFNLGSSPGAHLMHAFWSPLMTDDPTGINPKGYFGVATLNIAYACARNTQTNARGFAPKNYVVAGREWPVNRSRVTQVVTPTNQELNLMARSKINPVLYEVYSGGGRYVFRDSLTCALVESSLKKLISVADMSTSIDDATTKFGKDVLQLPMQIAVKRMRDFLTELFVGAEASGWLVPSHTPEMEGKAWKFVVAPNAVRPYDRMDCSYWLRYDGTVRQIFVTQTLTR